MKPHRWIIFSGALITLALAQAPVEQNVAFKAKSLNLGLPVTKLLAVPGTADIFSERFENGTVLWLPKRGAVAVYGDIGAEWNKAGAWNFFGFPMADEAACANDTGLRYQLFDKGALLWEAKTRKVARFPSRAQFESSGICRTQPIGSSLDVLTTIPPVVPEKVPPLRTGPADPCVGASPGPRNVEDNWSFERPLTIGWFASGDAFIRQPTFGDNVSLARLGYGSQAPPSLGGDYATAAWNAFLNKPWSVGQVGTYWIGTYEDRPDGSAPSGGIRGDRPVGTLSSKEFWATARFIDFLVGGGADPNTVRVELQVREPDLEAAGSSPRVFGRDGCYVTVAFATGDNTEWLRPARFDLDALGVPHSPGRSARARIRIVDWGMGQDPSAPGTPVGTGPGAVGPGVPVPGSAMPPAPVTGLFMDRPAFSPLGVAGHINADNFRFTDDPALAISAVRSTPVFGVVDTHAHPFAGVGFGGRLFTGQVGGNWRTSPIATDLPSDANPRHGGATFTAQGLLFALEPEALRFAPGRVLERPDAGACGSFLLATGAPVGAALTGVPDWFATTSFVGALVNIADRLAATAGPCVGPLADTVVTHWGGGFPEFDGYPKFYTKAHQQMHVSFIRRAYEGGLRIMSALVVTNGLLEYMMGPAGDRPSSDRENVLRQIEAIDALARANSDWMEIARSAADARRIIRSNKLAIVVGTEIDGNGALLPGAAEEVDFLYGLGIRQMTPIHLANNRVGGCSIYNDLFNTLTQFLNRTSPGDRSAFHSVEEGCAATSTGLPNPDCIEFKLDPLQYQVEDRRIPFLGPGPAGADPMPLATAVRMDEYSGQRGHRNSRGLTDFGSEYIRAMMRRGMLIDVDHMSSNTTDAVLGIAQRNNYPILSSHAGFRELKWHRTESGEKEKWPSDTHKTREQLRTIASLGGVVSPNSGEPEMRDFDGPNGVEGHRTPAPTVRNDAAGSAKSFAQAYLYALAIVGSGGGVGIGTDMNGLPGSAVPRFGAYAAYGLYDDDLRKRSAPQADQAFAQFDGVAYDRPLIDYRYHRFRSEDYLTQRQRDAMEALAIVTSGTSPDTAWQPGGVWRTFVQQEIVKNYARGFRATSESSLETGCTAANNACNEQRAAFLVQRNYELGAADRARPISAVRVDLSAENDFVRSAFADILPVYIHWKGFAASTANPPLRRHVIATPGGTLPQKDFDINIDGFAHYGLMPDFFQDLKNIGLPEYAMSALFNSAEQYIRMWEVAEQRAAAFGPGGPRP